MEDLKATLLMQIANLFMRNGIKSMTMDDIAKSMGISKKTLYKHFKNKADLVYKVLEGYLEEEKKVLEIICKSGFNAIDEMFEITKYASTQIKDINPAIHYDLQKYYPKAWQVFVNYKYNSVFAIVASNLQKGIREGFYRININIPIVAKIYISRIDMLFDPQLFPVSEFKFVDVLEEMIHYHIRGISGDKGLKHLLKKVKNTSTK